MSFIFKFLKWALGLAVVLAVVMALVVQTSFQHEAPEVMRVLEPDTLHLKDCAEGDSSCHSYLDCTDQKKACYVRSVSFDVDECKTHSKPGKCDNFLKRLPSITFASDSYNLIDAKIADTLPKAELIPSRLVNPWDLEFLPDGTMLISQLGGKIIHIDATGQQNVVATLDVLMQIETGMMGLAIDPDFSSNGYVYVGYGHRYGDDLSSRLFSWYKDGHLIAKRVVHRVSRFTFKHGSLQDETVILDDIPGSLMHAGMRLEFGPDGKLYVTTGDAGIAKSSQIPGFLGGKILRMNADGSVPDDNPSSGSYVYSMGHRNPQGLAWHPETGEFYSGEHGDVRMDEINRIEPGANYGWGTYTCERHTKKGQWPGELKFPVLCYRTWNISPSGMTFVADKESPWFGSLFVASLRGGHLHRYKLQGDEVLEDEIFYYSDGWDYSLHPLENRISRRIRDVEYHDGALYIIGDGYGLVKLTP